MLALVDPADPICDGLPQPGHPLAPAAHLVLLELVAGECQVRIGVLVAPRVEEDAVQWLGWPLHLSDGLPCFEDVDCHVPDLFILITALLHRDDSRPAEAREGLPDVLLHQGSGARRAAQSVVATSSLDYLASEQVWPHLSDSLEHLRRVYKDVLIKLERLEEIATDLYEDVTVSIKGELESLIN